MRAAGRTNRLAAAFWLAALALLLLALIPGGLMPAQGWSGSGALLVPCPGTTPMIAGARHGADQDGGKEAPRPADMVTCAFAALAAPHLPQASAPELLQRTADFVLPRQMPGGLAAPAGMSSPPPPSQGPPTTV